MYKTIHSIFSNIYPQLTDTTLWLQLNPLGISTYVLLVIYQCKTHEVIV